MEREVSGFKVISEVGIKKIAFYIADKKYLSELQMRERKTPVKFMLFADIEEAKQWILHDD